MSKRNKTYIQDYCLSLLFELVVPLFPMALEFWATGAITSNTLFLTAALYAISIGNGSTFKLMLGSTFLLSFIFAFCFGSVLYSKNPLPGSEVFTYASISCLFLASAIEKYKVYVLDKTPYWDFGG